MNKCLLTIQIEDADLSSRDKVQELLDAIEPEIAQRILDAQGAPRGRGCTVSGSVSSGPGGTSGSVTITCTL